MTDETADSFREYIDQVGDLPTSTLLGRIVMFQVTDEEISHAQLVQWFSQIGLNPDLLPAEIRELDAFKKATSGINGSTYDMTGNRTAHLLCRDVTSNNDYVRRQITREIKDGGKKRLSYNSAIEATYYRKSRNGTSGRPKLVINRQEVHPEELDHIRALAQDITDKYLRYANYHDGMKLRGTVRNYLKHLNAIEIKGGVYFIHASKDAELQQLNELVNLFGGGCWMKTLPLVDLKSEREFITKVFEREAAESLQEIARETATTKPTAAASQRLKERFDEVLSKAQEHMFNLQITQDLTAAAAEVAQDALTEFQTKVIGTVA